MKWTLQQLPGATEEAVLDKMIPIYISQRQVETVEEINFLDNSVSLSQLDKTKNIDFTTLKCNVTYWQMLTPFIEINNSGELYQSISDIIYTVELYHSFNEKSTFIVVDDNGEVVFASNFINAIYDDTEFLQATLTVPFDLNGVYHFCFIQKITEDLNTTQDASYNNVINIEFNDLFIYNNLITSFPRIVSSAITYGAIQDYNITYYNSITSDDIDSEYYEPLRQVLKLSKQCVAISYPSDKYLNQLLEDIDKLSTGYYIVPINLSLLVKNALYSKINVNSKTSWLSLLLSCENFVTNNIVSNLEYIFNNFTLYSQEIIYTYEQAGTSFNEYFSNLCQYQRRVIDICGGSGNVPNLWNPTLMGKKIIAIATESCGSTDGPGYVFTKTIDEPGYIKYYNPACGNGQPYVALYYGANLGIDILDAVVLQMEAWMQTFKINNLDPILPPSNKIEIYSESFNEDMGIENTYIGIGNWGIKDLTHVKAWWIE